MRHFKILFALILSILVTSSLIFGQDVSVKVTSDGKVGIGTTTPSGILDIVNGESGYATHFYYTNGNTYIRPSSTGNVIMDKGNVGIGTTTPGFPLNFASVIGDKISLWGQSGNHYGFGIQGNLLQIHTDIAASNIAFGHGNSSSFTEMMRIEGGGNVGIGTTSPSARLDIAPDANKHMLRFSSSRPWVFKETGSGTTSKLVLQSTADGKDFEIHNTNGVRIAHFHTSVDPSYERIYLLSGGGKLGIGTSSPSYTLDVHGSIAYYGTFLHSDLRWKKNITNLSGALDKVLKLRGVGFEWRKDEFSQVKFEEGTQIGFIAQEVEAIIPEIVSTNAEGFKSVAYTNVTAILVEAVKEQQSIIEKQNAELNEVKMKMARIESILHRITSETSSSETALKTVAERIE